MAGYGQSSRTPSTDANEGIVNPPAHTVSGRTTVSTKKKQPSGVDLSSIGATLGQAVQGYVDKDFENLRAKQALDGATQQGNGKAINQIAEDNKRTGFAEAVFGQNATYRGAQQQAVKNNVNEAFLKQIYSVSDHAGKSPEEYNAYLREQMEPMLEPFAGDKETYNMVASSWVGASEKLSQAHAKEHYGLMQTQAREGKRVEIRQAVDLAYTLNALEPGSGDFAIERMFTEVPKDMNETAWKSLIQEEINHSLKMGNTTMYKKSQEMGLEKNLNPKQQAQRDAAVSAHDQDVSFRGTELGEKTESQINAVLMGEVGSEDPTTYLEGIVEEYMKQVDGLETEITGSDKSKATIAALRNRLDPMLIRMNKAATTAETKLQEKTKNAGLMYNQLTNAQGAESALAQVSKEDQKESLDTVIGMYVQNTVKSDQPLDSTQSFHAALNDVETAKGLAQFLRNSPVVPPKFASAMVNYISAFGSRKNPDGTMSAFDDTTLKSLRALENTPFFNQAITGDNRVKYEQMKRAARAGLGMDVAENNANNIINKTFVPDDLSIQYGFNNETEKKHTRLTHVTDQLKTHLGQSPTPIQISKGMMEYKDALRATGTREGADEYLRRSIEFGGINLQGYNIKGGQYMDDIFNDYTFAGAIDTLTSAKLKLPDGTVGGSLLTVMLARSFATQMPNSEKHYGDLSQIKGWQFEADPHEKGFYFTAIGGKRAFVSNEWMRSNFSDALTNLNTRKKAVLDGKTYIQKQEDKRFEEFRKGIKKRHG